MGRRKRFNLSKTRKTISYHTKKPKIRRKVLKRSKKNKDVIYGQRSINAQIPNFMTRRTKDYDIFTKKPKKSAKKMQARFDKTVGSNQFYHKPALHPGTHKVMHVGRDMKKGTKDDSCVIDYTKYPKPKPKYKIINGVRYRRLSGEKKAKKKALRDKKMEFRHKKDKRGLQSINIFRRIFK